MESSRSVATPSGKIGIIAAVAAAAVAGGPATTVCGMEGGGPAMVCGDGVVLTGSCHRRCRWGMQQKQLQLRQQLNESNFIFI